MNSVLFYCIISIIFWLMSVCFIIRIKKDTLHVGVLFLLLYILNYPVKMIASKFGIYVINSNLWGNDAQVLAMILSDMATICIMLPLLLTRKIKRSNITEVNRKSGIYTVHQTYFTILFFFILMLIFWMMANGISSFRTMFSISLMKQRQVNLVNLRMNSAIRAFFSTLANMCQFFILRTYIFNWNKLNKTWHFSFVAFLLFIMWYGYAMTFSKQETLFPVLGIIVIYNISTAFFKHRPKLTITKLSILGVFGIFSVAMIGFARSFSRVESLDSLFYNAFRQFSFAFDAPDNLTAIISRMDNIWTGDLWLVPTLLNLFITYIPRFLWNSKPLLNGQLYIMSFYLLERFTGHLGETISPSIAGELIASGGVLFMILMSLLIGIFLYFLYQNAFSKKCPVFMQVIYSYALVQLNNLCRGGTVIISSVLFAAICLGILYIMYLGAFEIYFKRYPKLLPLPLGIQTK